MRKSSPLQRLIQISIVCGLALCACGRSKARIDEAYANLESGNFDAAFYSFHELYKKKPQNPRILAGMGLILSRKRTSLFTALDLLKTSLKIEANAEVRRQLAMIYVAMGESKRILDLTRSENLSVEEAFTPSLQQLHTMASCLEQASLRKLNKLKDAPQQEDSPFYSFLCEISLKQREEDSITLLKSYYAISNPKIRCEALSLCFIIKNILSPTFLEKEKKLCIDKSLALLPLTREKLDIKEVKPNTQKEEVGEAGLFDTDPFQPHDPGPEGLGPPWQYVLKKQEEEKEKEE